MKSIPKFVSGVSGFMLYLSLADPTQATEKIKPSDCAHMKNGSRDLGKCEEVRREGIDTIQGEVSGIEGDQYVVQQFYGKEVRLHTDATTQRTGSIVLGDSIEATVKESNNQKHVLSIRSTK